MKTIENLHAIRNADLEALRAFIRSRKEATEKLAAARTASSTPEATVCIFVEMVGQALATEVIASMVNHSAWDGRISRSNAEWAANIPQSWDADTAQLLHMYPDKIGMHKAHLDQIATAMAKMTARA